MASVRANFVTRRPGLSKFNTTITVHGRMYHEMDALIPPSGKNPRFSALWIHDTEHAAHNWKHFYAIPRENFLLRLASMLQGKSKLVGTFPSPRDLLKTNRMLEDVPAVIYAHERTKTGH